MKHEPFIMERTYRAPVSKVWKAITSKSDMKEWYFDIADFKPEVGFEFTFKAESPTQIYIHLCKITDVVVEKKLRYSWRYEGFPGLSYVTFELFPEGENTRLKLTHEGLETFPNTEAFARKNFEAGWTEIIGKNIKSFLEK